MDKKERFKQTLRMIESSGGRNTIPDESTSSGRAGGAYQMTPGTVQSLPQRLKNRGMDIDPQVEALSQNPDYESIRNQLNSNPELDERVGNAQTGLELNSANDDILKAAYLHHMGMGKPAPESLEELNKTNDPDYLKKFLDNYSQTSPDTNILDRGKFNRLKGKMK